jgi:hypothetical protein
MAGSSLIGNLAVNLSLETAAFQRNAAAAESRMKTMSGKFQAMGKNLAGVGAALGAGVVLGGLTSAVTSAFDMASGLSEAAEKLGLTVTGLQNLQTAASQTGVSNDQLDTSIGRLNRSMGDLQLGKDSAVKAFAAIGLSADDLKGKKPDEAMGMIADALNKIPDASERASMGAAIFGKGYAALIPMINGGSDALNKFAEQSKKNGQVSDESAKKLDELADRWSEMKTRVGVATANIIAASANMFDKVGGALTNLGDQARRFDEGIANMARSAVSWVNNMVTGISGAITGRLSAIWDGAKRQIETVRGAFENLYDKVQRNSYMPDMVQGIGEEFAKLASIMVDPALNATAKVGAAFQSLGRLAGGIFGQKAGGILGALGSFASALAPLFGVKSTEILTGGGSGPSIPKFARGGSGVFGGNPGVDRNVLSMNGSPIARVSKGEHFRVSPNGGGGRAMHFDLRGAVMTHDLIRQMNQIGQVATINGAQMGATGGHQATLQQQRRSIP